MKHNIYEFSLFLKIFCFVPKGSVTIPEYRCLLIGRVQNLYTIEHAVENIAYFRFQLIYVTLLSLVQNIYSLYCKGIEFLSQSLIFLSPYLCILMSETLDILNYEL